MRPVHLPGIGVGWDLTRNRRVLPASVAGSPPFLAWKKTPMVMLRIEPHLFGPLRVGFEAAAADDAADRY